MLPFTLAGIGLKLKSFFTNKWVILAAIVLAVGGGTYWYLSKTTNQIVAAKVENHDLKASNEAYKTGEAVRVKTDKVDERFDQLSERTREDYSSARQTIQEAPVDQRTAPAPDLIVDTLNNLDRLRSKREGTENPVSDAEVPVG